MSQTIQFAAQVSGAIRRETLEGREHVVVPATLVRSQVLENNLGKTFLPADEITDTWAEMANGMPVILDHPTHRGEPVSARTPSVLNRQGVGRLFNVRAEDGALKGDVFIDPSRSDDVKPLGVVLEKVVHGKPVELSTAFPVREVENESGAFENRNYEKVIRPGGFDHLAVFVEKTGACSVRDGCGLGVNCNCGDNVEHDADEVAEGIWARLKALITNQENDMERDEVYAELQSAGCPLSEERLAELEDEELAALAESYGEGGEGSEAEGEPEGVDPDGATDPKASDEGGDEPSEASELAAEELLAEVESLREKVSSLEAATEPAVQERQRERDQLVEELASNDRVPFKADDLEPKPLEELQKLRSLARGESYAGRAGPRRGAENVEPEYMEPVPYTQADSEED